MMPTLAQHFDADLLVQAIRQDPVPAHAAALAAGAVEAALRAYQAPDLEARRLAEEATGAVTDALAALSSVLLPPPPPPRRPQRPLASPLPAQPLLPPRPPPGPPVDLVALAPLGFALAALPLQTGAVSSLLVLVAAAGAGFVAWRSHRPPRDVAPPPRPLAIRAPEPPPEPPPPAATLQPEVIAAAVGRALLQIDALVAHTERRRVARTEPSTLNDATLEFLQDLAEAALRNRAEFALAKIEFRLPIVLEACDLTAEEYRPDTAAYFDVDGDPAQAVTRRPAILSAGRCVKRGLAATRPGRAA